MLGGGELGERIGGERKGRDGPCHNSESESLSSSPRLLSESGAKARTCVGRMECIGLGGERGREARARGAGVGRDGDGAIGSFRCLVDARE